MGRYDFRPQRVLATANLALETSRISTPPVWHQIVQDIPPPPRLTRPIKHHGAKKHAFKPQEIRYPEDQLRKEFFGDHPWELARPKVVLEDSGNDHAAYDWSFLEQEGKRIDGESVIQRQHHLMTHGHQPDPFSSPVKLSATAAYDLARKEFYTHRHFQDIERRIAKEEALHTGAYFQPGPNALAEPLEDAKFEGWKKWAAKRVSTYNNRRLAGYSGSEIDEGDGTGAEASMGEIEDMVEEDVGTGSRESTTQEAVAEAAEQSVRR